MTPESLVFLVHGGDLAAESLAFPPMVVSLAFPGSTKALIPVVAAGNLGFGSTGFGFDSAGTSLLLVGETIGTARPFLAGSNLSIGGECSLIILFRGNLSSNGGVVGSSLKGVGSKGGEFGSSFLLFFGMKSGDVGLSLLKVFGTNGGEDGFNFSTFLGTNDGEVGLNFVRIFGSNGGEVALNFVPVFGSNGGEVALNFVPVFGSNGGESGLSLANVFGSNGGEVGLSLANVFGTKGGEVGLSLADVFGSNGGEVGSSFTSTGETTLEDDGRERILYLGGMTTGVCLRAFIWRLPCGIFIMMMMIRNSLSDDGIESGDSDDEAREMITKDATMKSVTMNMRDDESAWV